MASRSLSAVRVAVVALTLIGGGCRPAPVDQQVEADYDKASGRLQLLKYDADRNGVPDTFSYMDGNRVVRIEIDTNGDGRIDRWEYYGEGRQLERVGYSRADDGREDAWSFADASGAIARIEVSTNRDGRVTRIEHYEHGTLVRAEEDSDGDGAMDRWESYDQTRLTRVGFDPDRTGAPTQALVYAADGTVHVE